MWKGHPEEPSGLYWKAGQHFEVLGTSRRKGGLEPELAKNLLLTTNTINSAVQTVSIQQSSMVVLRHLGIIVKGNDDKRDASHVTMCETGVKRSLPSSLRPGGPNPSKICSLLLLSSSYLCFKWLTPVWCGGVSREAMTTIENPLKQSFSHLLRLMTDPGLNCAEQHHCAIPGDRM